jgi:hypothetical protein
MLLSRRLSFATLALFVFFSGLDVVGMAFVTPLILAVKPEYTPLVSWRHIEPWAIGWQYSSHTTQLFWVPNQALAGWIVAGLLVYAIWQGQHKRDFLFLWALTLLWSPFITLGLLPILAADFFTGQGSWGGRLKSYLTLPNLCGLVMFALIALYYAAKVYPPHPFLGPQITHGFSLSRIEGTQAKILGLFVILIFCLLEFGLFALFTLRRRQGWNAKTKAVYTAGLLWLVLLPFYRYGALNDFVMRASIPGLFLIAIYLSQDVSSPPTGSLRRGVLMALLLLGAATAGIEIQRHIRGILESGSLINIPELDQVAGIWDYAMRMPDALLRQYFGSPNAFFFRILTR